MTGYDAALAVVVVAGVLPAGYFVWTYRPRQRWRLDALDAGGWVAIILVLYLLTAWRLVAGGVREPEEWWDGASSLLVAGLVDVVLWVRVLNWRRIRRDVERYGWPPRRRADDPPPGS